MLTEREQTVITARMMGFSNKEIAQMLGISLNTVKTYVGRVRRSLEANSPESIGDTLLGLLESGTITEQNLRTLIPGEVIERVETLTQREKEVIGQLRVRGQNSDDAIARTLVVERSTVKKHLINIYNTLGIRHKRLYATAVSCVAKPDPTQPRADLASNQRIRRH